jgi:hypothetical protein
MIFSRAPFSDKNYRSVAGIPKRLKLLETLLESTRTDDDVVIVLAAR